MPTLVGEIKKVNEEDQSFTFEYEKNKMKEKIKVFVKDKALLEKIKDLGKIKVEITYAQENEQNVLEKIKYTKSHVIYGYSGTMGKFLREHGEIRWYTWDYLILAVAISLLLLMIAPAYETLIVASIVFLIFIIYYFVIVPILIAILTIFTLGEAAGMFQRKTFNVEVTIPGGDYCNKIKEILKYTMLRKSFVDNIPEECIPDAIRKPYWDLKKAYNLFWRGIAIQGSSLIIAGLLLGASYYLKLFPLGYMVYIGGFFAFFFIVGFFISIWGSIKRRVWETPSVLRFTDSL